MFPAVEKSCLGKYFVELNLVDKKKLDDSMSRRP